MKIISSIRSAISESLGRSMSISPDIELPLSRIGSEYGGWWIFDEIVGEESIVYSFGLGDDISFDTDLSNRFGCKVHGFDGTPKSMEWLSESRLPDKFFLHPHAVADFDGELSFYPLESEDNVNHTYLKRPHLVENSVKVPCSRISTIMQRLEHNKINLLKMDIEGAEYQVIADLLSAKIIVDQILVEFHHRFDEFSVPDTKRALLNLKSAGYKVIHSTAGAREVSLVHERAVMH